MSSRFSIRIICAFVSMLALFGTNIAMADEKFSAEEIDFFENKVRPVLIANCLECHGAEKSESGLRLDSRTAILKGGESGVPAAISRKPNESLLIQSIRHTGDYDMPPNKKLTDEEISSLARWVEMGMPWPKESAISKLAMPELIEQHRKAHWAFQPVKPPKIPGAQTPSGFAIDKLIRQRLAEQNVKPSPRASKATLIRRAYFDLTGLPPTYREVQDFVKDRDPKAYEKLINRLLDSPHYGERWARHWLDVARYADTSGYKLDEADRTYPFAFTYRDYVIDALNKDLPYDQFIREQLAADFLDVPKDKHTLAALGFITVGRIYLSPIDTVDDQVDVVTRGMMGLTVSCARCHDHKYDAIPTQDYYSLFSVFQNCYVPSELPLLGKPEEVGEFQEYFEKLGTLKEEIKVYRHQRYADLRKHLDEYTVEYLTRVAAPDQEELVQKLSFIKLMDTQLRPAVLQKWRSYLAQRLEKNPGMLMPSVELLKLPNEGFANNASKLIEHWTSEESSLKVHPLVLKALQDQPPQSKPEVGKIYGELFKRIVDKWKAGGSKKPLASQFKGKERELATLVFNPQSPIGLVESSLDRYMTLPEQKQIKKLRGAVTVHNSNAPSGIKRAMVLRDKEKIYDERVAIRGNIHNRGELAPRRFVALLSEPDRPKFKQGSGRLELAEKIASKDNPLTARVLVNRVWMHHFSTPIVDTPSDFGIRCEEPLQRDVLDYLARDFMDHGWSIKRLHRKIMLSDTYCQSSVDRPKCSKLDPENRLYWKMNRRRLEFEPLRDSMLAVTGELDRSLHGKSVDLQKRPFSKRRTIYGHIDRQDLPGLFRVFDLASPDQSAAKRTRTSVPQQSLFMLNSEFTMEQARHLIRTAPGFEDGGRQNRITSIYRAILQRDPNAQEIEVGVKFIDTANNETPSDVWSNNEKKNEDTAQARKERRRLTPWQRYAQILMCSNEFEFID